MKKLLFIILIFPAIDNAQCPQWINVQATEENLKPIIDISKTYFHCSFTTTSDDKREYYLSPAGTEIIDIRFKDSSSAKSITSINISGPIDKVDSIYNHLVLLGKQCTYFEQEQRSASFNKQIIHLKGRYYRDGLVVRNIIIEAQ